jgi:plasmid stabilization system protein ParE
MKIDFSDEYINEFMAVWDFIAQDSFDRANSFKDELKAKIADIPLMPYKYRRSTHFNHEDIRDLIFKGYTVPYFIDKANDRIFVLGILKYKSDFEINGAQ